MVLAGTGQHKDLELIEALKQHRLWQAERCCLPAFGERWYDDRFTIGLVASAGPPDPLVGGLISGYS